MERIGKRFRSMKTPIGTALYGQSAQSSGFCNYNRCLTIIIADEGLYLRIWLMFRLGHPAFLILWEEIRNHRARRSLQAVQMSFEIGNPAIARMTILPRIKFCDSASSTPTELWI